MKIFTFGYPQYLKVSAQRQQAQFNGEKGNKEACVSDK